MSTFDQKSLENMQQPASCSCFGFPNSRNSIPCITVVSLALAERQHLSLRILQNARRIRTHDRASFCRRGHVVVVGCIRYKIIKTIIQFQSENKKPSRRSFLSRIKLPLTVNSFNPVGAHASEHQYQSCIDFFLELVNYVSINMTCV